MSTMIKTTSQQNCPGSLNYTMHINACSAVVIVVYLRHELLKLFVLTVELFSSLIDFLREFIYSLLGLVDILRVGGLGLEDNDALIYLRDFNSLFFPEQNPLGEIFKTFILRSIGYWPWGR
jgi:hypothetical protein